MTATYQDEVPCVQAQAQLHWAPDPQAAPRLQSGAHEDHGLRALTLKVAVLREFLVP